MFGIGVQELVVIFLIIFLLFGAKSLPELAKGLGQAMRLFKKEMSGIKDGLTSEDPKKISDDPESLPINHANDFNPETRPHWRPKTGA